LREGEGKGRTGQGEEKVPRIKNRENFTRHLCPAGKNMRETGCYRGEGHSPAGKKKGWGKRESSFGRGGDFKNDGIPKL